MILVADTGNKWIMQIFRTIFICLLLQSIWETSIKSSVFWRISRRICLIFDLYYISCLSSTRRKTSRSKGPQERPLTGTVTLSKLSGDTYPREYLLWGSKGGAVVRALASNQCGPGSNPSVDAICGLSLLLVLSTTGSDIFPSSSRTQSNAVDLWFVCLLIIYLLIYFYCYALGLFALICA